MRFRLRFALFPSLLLALAAGPCLADTAPPINPRQIAIEDGEFLTYGHYVGGERYQDLSIVSRFSSDRKTMHVYLGKRYIGTDIPMPRKYRDYQRQFVISLETASMLSSFGDYYKESIAQKLTGEVAFDIAINDEKHVATYSSKIWDGYELRTKTTRVKLVPKYPVWDAASLAFVGSRYLDLSGRGIVYGVYPTIVKEAVPISARFIGKETIEIPLGRFQTLKYGIGVTDPFLAQLLESYVKELVVWIEDSPRALVIKTQAPGEANVLESISTWKE